MKNDFHYFSDYFRKYNYGKAGNILHYNSTTPPDYNLFKVTAATYIYQSKYDIMATPEVTITVLNCVKIVLKGFK